jgi:hypothetical protein
MREPDQSSNAGYRIAAINRGRLLWVTFLGKTRKVTGVRGRTPATLVLMLDYALALTRPCIFPPVVVSYHHMRRRKLVPNLKA